MRGMYRGDERAVIRELWRRDQTPHFMQQETEPLRPFLQNRTGMVAVDAGANKGFWTKAFLTSYGQNVSHVYMIDASPENHQELTNKEDSLLLEEADFHKVTAHHFAVGDSTGEILLHTNEDGSPLSSVHKRDLEAVPEYEAQAVSIEVPLDTIDNFVARESIKHIDVLKLDVEGNELHALNGASSCLSKNMIDVITWEFGIHQIEPRHFFKDFYRLLSRHGFDINILQNGTVVPIPSYNPVYEVFHSCVVFLAVRRASRV